MEPSGASVKNFFRRIWTEIQDFWHWIRQGIHDIKVAFLTKYTHWVDLKLEPYRQNSAAKTPSTELTSEPVVSPDLEVVSDHGAEQIPAPTTTGEFLELLRRTPKSVISSRERHVIATVMNFQHIKVSDLMLGKEAITYVKDDEVLGPLTLDRLYRSGFQHFPVLNYDRKIIGVIHTTALNSLETKETSRAIEILDPKVFYLREDYTLNQALAAFMRTNCYFFLVIDHYERITGILTYQMLMEFLLGETSTDNFDRDSDRLAVAKR